MIKIVCQNIRSAWNVGALIRSCEGVGAEIVLLGYTPLPVGNTLKLIEKTSIGAEKRVKWQHFETTEEFLQSFPKSGQNIHLGIEISDTSLSLYDYLINKENTANLRKSENIFLWLGNEIHGLEQSLEEKLDGFYHLPMRGNKESLNVSNCGTTVLYLLDFAIEKLL